MDDRIPLEVIVIYPRGYKAIIMTLRQKAVVMVSWKGFWRRLPMTSLEHGAKGSAMCREYYV